MTMNVDKELDARGLNCPLPILRTKKALTDMGSGQVLRILATDPGSVKGFTSGGHDEVERHEQEGVLRPQVHG
jgi:tRNA 2-thiouridine synthesizing protein A